MFTITREIGIDMGHRVTYHGSKCKNLHGHRYTVQAECHGGLISQGEQQGMVLDFGFLKEEMMQIIDHHCDHGTTLWVDDPFVPMFKPNALEDVIRDAVGDAGFWFGDSAFGKLYLIAEVPTAENLAKHWYERLAPRVVERSLGNALLKRIVVWETPNCQASYPVY